MSRSGRVHARAHSARRGAVHKCVASHKSSSNAAMADTAFYSVECEMVAVDRVRGCACFVAGTHLHVGFRVAIDKKQGTNVSATRIAIRMARTRALAWGSQRLCTIARCVPVQCLKPASTTQQHCQWAKPAACSYRTSGFQRRLHFGGGAWLNKCTDDGHCGIYAYFRQTLNLRKLRIGRAYSRRRRAAQI